MKYSLLLLLFPLSLIGQQPAGLDLHLNIPTGTLQKQSYPGLGADFYLNHLTEKGFYKFTFASVRFMQAVENEGEEEESQAESYNLGGFGFGYYHGLSKDWYVGVNGYFYSLNFGGQGNDQVINLGLAYIPSGAETKAEIGYFQSILYGRGFVGLGLGYRFEW